MPSNSKFIRFKTDVSGIEIPDSFTYPFNYEPHALAKIAAEELQQYIESQNEWVHNFGLTPNETVKPMGKMFGVLVVKNTENQLGYLAAFSGILANQTILPHFVPPVYNRKANKSFFIPAENNLNILNQRVTDLEKAPDFLKAKTELAQYIEESEQARVQRKATLKQAKKMRHAKRDRAINALNAEEYNTLNETLINESKSLDYEYKRWVKSIKLIQKEKEQKVQFFEKEMADLKQERKSLSAYNQELLFAQYQLVNASGQVKDVPHIFKDQNIIPPAGAGDCAAPKLLQFAFLNNLVPVVMAEFWWGAAPQQEVRKHKYYYPACKSKCEPILNHMLTGLKVDPNPRNIEPSSHLTVDVVFEDAHIAIINKPHELLSVPGKNVQGSVFQLMLERFPDATGPLMVHRLDQSTSGIMIIAKSREAHKNLQRQFEKRTIKKQYIAILDGVILKNEGKIDLPLRVDLDNRPQQMVCYQHGKNATTLWKVLERKNNKTKILFTPITGRTHQLRVHAAHPDGLNASILGDDIYGKPANRLHLHAQRIWFKHPVSNENMEFTVEAEF